MMLAAEDGTLFIVKDFLDVFPEDLLGIPSERNVEFCMDV